MCLSNNRTPVTFSNTILLAAEVEIDGNYRHLCGYYNKVNTDRGRAAANAMWSSVASFLEEDPVTVPPRGGLRSTFDEHPQPLGDYHSSDGPLFGYDAPTGVGKAKSGASRPKSRVAPGAAKADAAKADASKTTAAKKVAAKKVAKGAKTAVAKAVSGAAASAASSAAASGKAVAMPLGNAMLIAIPAKPGTMTGDNLIPVGKYPSFMTDYARALIPQRPMTRGSRGRSLPSDGVQVVSNFDNGTYDVVIADSAKKIVGAIALVAEAKRPAVNAELYAQLDKLYPKWTFLLFCFSDATASQAGCALVSYEPMKCYEHMLYLPGLDGHQGEIEQGKVGLNHTIVLGSYRMSATAPSKRVAFREPAISFDLPFLPSRVIGTVLPVGTRVPQGDFLFRCEDVANGVFRGLRAQPPGWSKVFAKGDDEPFYITS